MLLGAPQKAHLEVIGDANGFVANFWRSVAAQPDEVARWADYPVSHIDMIGRHRWLLEQRPRLAEILADPLHPGDAQAAGWWVWGQCIWIGSGWADWTATSNDVGRKNPHVSSAGRGIHALGQVPHVSSAGSGLTSPHSHVHSVISELSRRLHGVRAIHGSWDRCLNMHYGQHSRCSDPREGGVGVFLDPPYVGFESLYSDSSFSVAPLVDWCREHESDCKIALCGHVGDYDLPGWSEHRWKRERRYV